MFWVLPHMLVLHLFFVILRFLMFSSLISFWSSGIFDQTMSFVEVLHCQMGFPWIFPSATSKIIKGTGIDKQTLAHQLIFWISYKLTARIRTMTGRNGRTWAITIWDVENPGGDWISHGLTISNGAPFHIISSISSTTNLYVWTGAMNSILTIQPIINW